MTFYLAKSSAHDISITAPNEWGGGGKTQKREGEAY